MLLRPILNAPITSFKKKQAYFFRPGNKTGNSLKKSLKSGTFWGLLPTFETQQPQIISRKIWHLLGSKLDKVHHDHPMLLLLCHKYRSFFNISSSMIFHPEDERGQFVMFSSVTDLISKLSSD